MPQKYKFNSSRPKNASKINTIPHGVLPWVDPELSGIIVVEQFCHPVKPVADPHPTRRHPYSADTSIFSQPALPKSMPLQKTQERYTKKIYFSSLILSLVFSYFRDFAEFFLFLFFGASIQNTSSVNHSRGYV